MISTGVAGSRVCQTRCCDTWCSKKLNCGLEYSTSMMKMIIAQLNFSRSVPVLPQHPTRAKITARIDTVASCLLVHTGQRGQASEALSQISTEALDELWSKLNGRLLSNAAVVAVVVVAATASLSATGCFAWRV